MQKGKVLFTGFYFQGYHGSMMLICELAEYLTSLGYDCYCASVVITYEIKQYAISKGLKVMHANDLPLNMVYDIVWAYHFPILGTLLSKGLKYKKIHVGCLSSFHPLEVLPPYYKECSFVSCVSDEAKKVLVDKYHLNASVISVIPNLLPDKFCIDASLDKTLKRILIVSNHPPLELQLLPGYIPNVEVDFLGQESGNYEAITPNLLSKYNVIITIGKTVQYAMGMGIPVFEYDIFGGCGYINTKNYLEEEKFNYSGRKTNRKLTIQDIADELVAQYSETLKQVNDLKNIARERYLLSKNVNSVLDMMKDKHINLDEYILFLTYSRAFVDAV